MNRPTVSIDAILYRSARPLELATFYQHAFGFEAPKWVGADHVGVAAANCYLGFDLVDEAGPPATRVSVWFRVDDAPAAYIRLLELGATDKSPPDSECSPGETLAEVFDPEGNVVGLIGPAS